MSQPPKLGLLSRLGRLFGLSTVLYGGARANQARGARYAGSDLANNRYWELPNAHGDLRPSASRRFVEYYRPGTYQEHAMREEKEIPVQWALWLRHTRMDAPSLDVRALLLLNAGLTCRTSADSRHLNFGQELKKDVERIRITRHNARVLELKRLMELQAESEARDAAHAAALESERAQKLAAAELSAPAAAAAAPKRGRRRVLAAVPTSEVTAEGIPDSGVAPEVVTVETKGAQAEANSASPTPRSSLGMRAGAPSSVPQPSPPATSEPQQPANVLSDDLKATLDPEVKARADLRAQRRQAAVDAELAQNDPIKIAQERLLRARQEVNKSVLNDFEIDWTDGTGPDREH